MEVTKHTFRGPLWQVAIRAIMREKALRRQRTFTYCPRCNFELCSMNNAEDMKNGHVYHICKNCGAGTEWDYDMPAPINVT